MLILLPPSETKRVGGTRPYAAGRLAHAKQIGDARTRVREALEALSADPPRAVKALGLGVKNQAEVDWNLALATSGAMPAIERYTGVLYDALGALTLDNDARAWVDAHVSVQSALFGLIGANNRIPTYRVSAGTSLPSLGGGLKKVWREAHEALHWKRFGFVLDLRSKDYQQCAPLPPRVGVELLVATEGPDGQAQALNHFNKAAKGHLVRTLAQSMAAGASDITSARDLAAWGETVGLEFRIPLGADGPPDTVTLITSLGAPTPR